MGRAPACAMAYFILFKKVTMYRDVKSVDTWIKSYRKVSAPNLNAVTIVTQKQQFKDYQSRLPEDFQN